MWALASGWPASLGRVPDFSEPRVLRHRNALKGFRHRIASLAPGTKGSKDWLEIQLLKSEIALGLYHWGSEGDYRKNPLLYLNHWVYGLWYLMIRVPNAAERLRATLRFLSSSEALQYAALQNLAGIPTLWIKIAEKEAVAFRQFLKEVKRELMKQHPRQRSDIAAAVKRADRVMLDFQGLLKRKSRESRGVEFAVGKSRFHFLLKHYHRSNQGVEQLSRFGQEKIQETEALLQEIAESIDKTKSWKTQLGEGKKQHAKANQLIQIYQDEVRRVKGFLKRKKLITFPKGESLRVMATPEFSRETVPFAAYTSPAMFSGKNRGIFFVTVPGAKDKSALEEHNAYSLKVTTVHEAYPGHHLQFARQKQLKSLMGRNFHCASFYEGWALYCEELMHEQGYYDSLTRLNQLRDRLWRSCRVVIDVGLHTGEMTENEAVQLLVRKVGMDPAGARGEVNWYTLQPTVPQAYLTGMEHILQLRSKLERRWGRGFTLTRFHDRLLDYGAIPLSLVTEMLYSSGL